MNKRWPSNLGISGRSSPDGPCVADAAPWAPLIAEVVEYLLRQTQETFPIYLAPATIAMDMPKKRDVEPTSLKSVVSRGAEILRPKVIGPNLPLTPSQFASKWTGSIRTERAASQEHFIDLCRMLGFQTPNEADPTGESYAFDKGTEKIDGGDGFADVWKQGHFAWEYKGKRKDLGAAYSQLLQYREALENPPLLVVCDLDRFQVHTNFTNTVKTVYKFTLADLATKPQEPLRILRALMGEPEALRPSVTLHELTERAASNFAELAEELRADGHDPHQIAHFLNKLVFCMFAQHASLLPARLVQRLAENTKGEAKQFAAGLRELFSKMSSHGGLFGPEEIQWFNGGLFDGDDVLPLTKEQIEVVRAVAELDWSQIEPAIFGTLFERGMDPEKRSQLGAHYTDRQSMEDLIEPVILAPLRREFTKMKSDVDDILSRPAKDDSAKTKRWNRAHEPFKAFLDRLRSISVLDPACGSGNFLYVALQSLKNLERDVILWGSRVLKGNMLFPGVGPQVVRGIELNTYAAELARVSIWIGEIQWMLNNGFHYQRNPVLRPLKNIECGDAVLDRTEPGNPKEVQWPHADFIVGNPQHLGGKLLRERLTDQYVDDLFMVYRGRVAAESDYACYWFEKARQAVEDNRVKRVGLIGPQGIRGGANRKVLDRIKETGDIFLAWSDRPWVLEGAQTHVSLVGFDNGSEDLHVLDGKTVTAINADLTTGLDLTKVPRLVDNLCISFMGDTKGGPFDIPPEEAQKMLVQANPHGKPNSDVVVPWLNGASITKNPREFWIIDFGTMSENEASLYEAPFEYVKSNVEKSRKASRTTIEQWWLHERPRPKMRAALAKLDRFIGTLRNAKHRIFVWIPIGTVPDCQLIVFARSDDYFFGVLQSRIHTVWSLAKGTQLRERETGFRYTPTTTFETFPLPRPTDRQIEAIATAAKALETFRQGWLKPQTGPQRTLTQLYTDNPTWLRQAHERLDQSVAAAYGWPANLRDDEILCRVFDLNAKRTPVAQGTDSDD